MGPKRLAASKEGWRVGMGHTQEAVSIPLPISHLNGHIMQACSQASTLVGRQAVCVCVCVCEVAFIGECVSVCRENIN